MTHLFFLFAFWNVLSRLWFGWTQNAGWHENFEDKTKTALLDIERKSGCGGKKTTNQDENHDSYSLNKFKFPAASH